MKRLIVDSKIEDQVVALTLQGKTIPVISAEMGISRATVDRCRRRRHCPSRAVRRGNRNNLIITPPPSKETLDTVERFTLAGHSAAGIAKRLHFSVRTIQRYQSDRGCLPKRATKITEEEKLIAKKMLEDGASYKEVGRTLGRSDSAFSRYFPGYAWTPQQTGKHAALMRWADRNGVKV